MINCDLKIIMATANAKFHHTSFALRSLVANLKQFKEYAHVQEFTINDRPIDVAWNILLSKPQFVCLSVYIWNLEILTQTASIIKKIAPKTCLILGGPEVSFYEDQPCICSLADYIICGEGEEELPRLIGAVIQNKKIKKWLFPEPVDLDHYEMPYYLYTQNDIENRTIYLESSRGCQYGCEFCLSCLSLKIRKLDVKKIINEIDQLYKRGVRNFKFIDRTISSSHSTAILQYFSDLNDDDIFIHFEIVPGHISSQLLEHIKHFQKGSLQFEAGVQTLNQEVSNRIGRKQNSLKCLSNLEALGKSRVHIHADLVWGLPGESIKSIEDGFNILYKTQVHEIQLGILKRLRGAPIDRHSEKYQMIYNDSPPYELLCNKDIDFFLMQRLKRFSRYFNLVHNNGNFKKTALTLLEDSPFSDFMNFSDWLFDKTGQTNHLALDRIAELLFLYLTSERKMPDEQVADNLFLDYLSANRRRFPACIREHTTLEIPKYSASNKNFNIPMRQKRHST